MKVNSKERICILRSAFLGDWITAIPFIIYLTEECNIPIENITVISINNKGINPIEKIHGVNSALTKNSFIVNSSSVKSTLKSSLQIRGQIDKKIDRLIYLPFTFEKSGSIVKKYLLSLLLVPLNIKRNGFKKFQKSFPIPNSQYFSFFYRLGLEYDLNRNSINSFLLKESIKPNKTNDILKKKIAIYPNSKLTMKIWPISNFIKVINCLSLKYNASFYLIGSIEDYDYNNFLIKHLSPEINIKNVAGSLDIPDTIRFLSTFDLLISNDGAPIHMGALVNVPIVGIYTNKEPIGSWDPVLTNNFISIRTDVICKNCFSDKCINPICIKYIPVSVVINACEKLLDRTTNVMENIILVPQIPISFHTKYNYE